jgi:hypothetical protein
VTSLFTVKELKIKRGRVGERRARRRIPTGAPILLESRTERAVRMDAESWSALIDGIRRSCEARVELYKTIEDDAQLPCPWARIVTCDSACKCGGAKKMTVRALRRHYAGLVFEILKAVRP